MAARVILRIFALIGVVLSACNGLELRASSTNVPLDGQIVISCTATIDFYTSVTLSKVYPEDDQKPYVTIADNEVLATQFKALGRYKMELNVIDQESFLYEFTLTIEHAVVEDSGNFTCKTKDDDKKMITVNVVVPPESIDMSIGTVDSASMHIVDDGEEMKFDGGENRHVVCNVHGGNPAPILQVMVGDMDITDQFTITKLMMREKTSTKGLVILRSSITAEAKSLPMKGIYSRKRFQCVAKPAVEGVEPTSVGFMAKFSGYAPQIECTDTLISYVHQTNVNITCTVTAQPRPDKIYFYYYLQHTNSTVEVQPGLAQGHYRGEVYDNPENEETFEMVLFIDRVFPQMFRNYYFVAESSYGKAEHKIYLERDRSRESAESDASRIGGVVALVVLAVAAPLLSYL